MDFYNKRKLSVRRGKRAQLKSTGHVRQGSIYNKWFAGALHTSICGIVKLGF